MTIHNRLSPPEYGTTIKIKSASEFLLWESSYAPYLNIPHHVHENGYFDLILRGSYVESTTKERKLFSPSSLIYHPPGVEHADQILGKGLRIFKIKFPPSWLSELQKSTKIINYSTSFGNGETIRLAVKLHKEFRESDAFSSLIIEGIVLEMIAEASRYAGDCNESHLPRRLKQTRELLHESFSEHLTVSCIADAVGIHPVHLTRIFRKHFRCTIGEYIRQLRVESSCNALANSDKPLIEIASTAGFSDQSHFCRSFKSITGLSPAQYRATFRR